MDYSIYSYTVAGTILAMYIIVHAALTYSSGHSILQYVYM